MGSLSRVVHDRGLTVPPGVEAPDGKAPSCLRGRRSACEVKPTAQGSVCSTSAAQGSSYFVCTASCRGRRASACKTLARVFLVFESNADLDRDNWVVQRRPRTLSGWLKTITGAKKRRRRDALIRVIALVSPHTADAAFHAFAAIVTVAEDPQIQEKNRRACAGTATSRSSPRRGAGSRALSWRTAGAATTGGTRCICSPLR